MKQNRSTAFLSPKAYEASGVPGNSRHALYKKEKEVIKKEFESLGGHIDWTSPDMQKKLSEFAAAVITTITDQIGQVELITQFLPVETIQPGETLTIHEIHGPTIYYSTYGASVRMSRPQFTKFTATTNLKEIGLKLNLVQLQVGKYSASELADYATKLITAWRNRFLFVDTLKGLTDYQAAGSQNIDAGGALVVADVDDAIDAISDEFEMSSMIGRRLGIHQLAQLSPWAISTSSTSGPSDLQKREFETNGIVGNYAGMNVLKVNSFTDLDYGQVYPFPSDEIWMFSDAPVGTYVQAGALRTSNETILQNETLNIFMRWDDGIGIFHTDRAAVIDGIT